jgi:hypothetical protein
MVPVLGGDEGARTPDLDSAIVALSQLSYIPNVLYSSILSVCCKGVLYRFRHTGKRLSITSLSTEPERKLSTLA